MWYVYEGLLLAGAAFVAIITLLLRPGKGHRARSARIDRLLEEAAERKIEGGPLCWALLPSERPSSEVCGRPDGHAGPHRCRHDDGGCSEWFDSADDWAAWRRRLNGRVDG